MADLSAALFAFFAGMAESKGDDGNGQSTIWMTAPNNGGAGWQNLGGEVPTGDGAAIHNPDGRLQVFAALAFTPSPKRTPHR
ncbi:hypothetical protein [Streptomyces sp. NPDC051286]|uniref:hypothetical protein n=1 Tax=Streptomyces sp. NPDC051286 TaxID=3365647 RepID=UPI0037B24276